MVFRRQVRISHIFVNSDEIWKILCRSQSNTYRKVDISLIPCFYIYHIRIGSQNAILQLLIHSLVILFSSIYGSSNFRVISLFPSFFLWTFKYVSYCTRKTFWFDQISTFPNPASNLNFDVQCDRQISHAQTIMLHV